jgi:hypothetical protein
VKRFWKSPNHDLESELRKHRPEPRSQFLASLAADVSRQRGNRIGARVALAGALSVAMLAIFAGLGGMGYAANAAQQVVKVTNVANVVSFSNAQNNNSNNEKGNGGNAYHAGNGGNGGNGDNGDNGGNNGHHDDDADDDEYKPGKGCGDKNHVHSRHNECKDDHGHH